MRASFLSVLVLSCFVATSLAGDAPNQRDDDASTLQELKAVIQKLAARLAKLEEIAGRGSETPQPTPWPMQPAPRAAQAYPPSTYANAAPSFSLPPANTPHPHTYSVPVPYTPQVSAPNAQGYAIEVAPMYPSSTRAGTAPALSAHTNDPAARPELKVFRLENASAEELVATVRSLFSSQPEPRLSIVSDKRTNSLIMRGPKSILSEAEAVLETLDAPANEQ
jgi:hypothetical protein